MKKVRTRPALSNFTRNMELVLQENDHKGREGWRAESRKQLTRMMLDEFFELLDAKNDDARRKECCDIANFAMMIFDNIDRSD